MANSNKTNVWEGTIYLRSQVPNTAPEQLQNTWMIYQMLCDLLLLIKL